MKSRSVIRVRYAETDQMGMVYHSNFLEYFEIGRTDFFRQSGFTYRQMEAEGVYMPVMECFCRYLVPGRYDDELEILTMLQMESRLKLKFMYEVMRISDGTKIAEGYSVHVPTNADGKPCRVPQSYREVLKRTSSKSKES